MYEENERAKKIDWFALVVAVHCKTDATLRGILNEKDTVEKIPSRVNKYSINKKIFYS